MKKNVPMVSFNCLVREIWEEIVFYVVIRREPNAWFVLFLKHKKLT